MNKETFLKVLKEIKDKYGNDVGLQTVYDVFRRMGYHDKDIKYWLKKLDGIYFVVKDWRVYFDENFDKLISI